MIRLSSRPLALATLILAAACAGNTQTAGDGATAAASSQRAGYDRNRISPEEIVEASGRNIMNAYDLIQSARPQWLRATASGMGGSAGQIIVFENRNRMGTVEQLRGMTLTNIESIRYLTPSEAQIAFGLDVNNGAIQVISRTGR